MAFPILIVFALILAGNSAYAANNTNANGKPFQNLQDQINVLNQSVESIQQKINSSNQNLSSFFDVFAEFKQQTQDSFFDVFARLDALNNRVSSFFDVFAEFKQQTQDSFFDVFTRLDKVNSRLDTIDTEILSLSLQSANLQNQVNGLNQSINSFFDVFTEFKQQTQNSFFDIFTELQQEKSNRMSGDSALSARIDAQCLGSCTGELAPVCASDGKTYINPCAAQCSHVTVINNGSCQPVVSCTPGFANCDGNNANGCETNIESDVNNCGGCGVLCSSNNINAACISGLCTGTCNSGFADCNGNKLTDGCEINIMTDKNNCGACGQACAGDQSCISGACVTVEPKLHAV